MDSKRANSITDEVVNAVMQEERSVESIARESGVGASTIRGWINNGKTPTLENAQWVLKVLGFRLTIEKERVDDNG